jgi:hypothetical protein
MTTALACGSGSGANRCTSTPEPLKPQAFASTDETDTEGRGVRRKKHAGKKR